MRDFADACLTPSLEDLATIQAMAEAGARLGVRYLGLRVPLRDLAKAPRLREIFAERGISIATRIDIREGSRQGLLRQLGSVRGRFELIAVECMNMQLAMVAARDRRVDILVLDPLSRIRFTTSLAHVCRAALEVNFNRFLRSTPRPLLLSRLRGQLTLASENEVAVVCSSHARDKWGMRSPCDMAAFCNEMGLDASEALGAVSTNATSRILTNRSKLSEDYISEGVRVISRGEDEKAAAVSPHPTRVRSPHR